MSTSSLTSFSRSFHLTSSSSLRPGCLRMLAMEWGNGGNDNAMAASQQPTLPQIILVAREVALIYADKAMAFPDRDHIPVPRLWVVVDKGEDDSGQRGGVGGPDGDASTMTMTASQRPSVRPLRQRLRSLGLTVVRQFDAVDPDILERAMQFSVEARLSPAWNRVGPYFMEGRQFLFHPSVAALKPRLYLDTSNFAVRLMLNAGQLRSPPLTMDDFALDQSIRRKFDEGKVDSVPREYIGRAEVNVLPNLTRATVFSITRRMVQSPKLKTWKDMRRYWKNMYGFRLQLADEDEEPLFYINVFFGCGAPDSLFSYPCWCVRANEPVELPRINPVPIIDKFVDDFAAKVSSVCGQALFFPPRLQQPILHPQTQMAPAATWKVEREEDPPEPARAFTQPNPELGHELDLAASHQEDLGGVLQAIPLKPPQFEMDLLSKAALLSPPQAPTESSLVDRISRGDDPGVIVGSAVSRNKRDIELPPPQVSFKFSHLEPPTEEGAGDRAFDFTASPGQEGSSQSCFQSTGPPPTPQFPPWSGASSPGQPPFGQGAGGLSGSFSEHHLVDENTSQQPVIHPAPVRPVFHAGTTATGRQGAVPVGSLQVQVPPVAPRGIVPVFRPIQRPLLLPAPAAAPSTPNIQLCTPQSPSLVSLNSSTKTTWTTQSGSLAPRQGSFLDKVMSAPSPFAAPAMNVVPLRQPADVNNNPTHQPAFVGVSSVVTTGAVRKNATLNAVGEPIAKRKKTAIPPAALLTDQQMAEVLLSNQYKGLTVANLSDYLRRHNVFFRKKDKKDELILKARATLNLNA